MTTPIEALDAWDDLDPLRERIQHAHDHANGETECADPEHENMDIYLADSLQGDYEQDAVYAGELCADALRSLLPLVRKIAGYRTMDEIEAASADKDYEDVADELDDARATAVDDLDGLIYAARDLI